MRVEPTATERHSARTAFAALPTAPAAARSFVRLSLGSWGLRADADTGTAELVVSELVTNAVRATTGLPGVPLITIELRTDATALRIAVRDDAGGRPVPRAPDEDAETGRGLLLVTALCTRWDVTAVPGGGKVVRVELPLADR